MDPIPLTKPSIDDSELSAVREVFESGWLAGQGPKGRELEAKFAALTGTGNAVAVNNCTAGLHLSLSALGIGPGDEVLIADYSFPATAHAALYCGATPVFVDVRADTGTIDVDLIPALVTERTKAIVAVDSLGIPADWAPLATVAGEFGLALVEDAACSIGATYQGSPCGSFGDVAAFSLHARKGITSGEGGVVCTRSADLASTIRRDSCFGMTSAFERQASAKLVLPAFTDLGYNYKLSDVLAAIALVQLRKLEGLISARDQVAATYAELLASVPGIEAPQIPADRTSSWQTYAVTVSPDLDRDALVLGLREHGIGSNIGTYALHRETVYGEAARRADCPVSRSLFERHLALPMYAEITKDQQIRVVDTLLALIP